MDSIVEYLSLHEIPWGKIGEICTWVLLFSLIPGTALGFFAEKSVPGQLLYPMKRGMENVVLTLESVNPYTRSSYLATLANNRVQETNDIVLNAVQTGTIQDTSILNTTASSLQAITDTIRAEAATVKTITNPVQKKQAEAQLNTSIQNYQGQLSQMQSALQPQQQQSTPTPTPTQTQQVTQNTSENHVIPSPTETPIPSPSLDQTIALQQQISQTQDTLQSIASTLPPPTPQQPQQQLAPSPTQIPIPPPQFHTTDHPNNGNNSNNQNHVDNTNHHIMFPQQTDNRGQSNY